MWRVLSLSLLMLLPAALSGCMIVQVGVTNPIPGLSRVAVVPFYNLSQERAVDGRQFAMAYFAELQKTPGFQVIPVGVAEQAIIDHQLQMNNPADVLRLARILNVDAVAVGAVTDWDPYDPPRLGLQVSWYAPDQWAFYPGIATDPEARGAWERAELEQARLEMEQKELANRQRAALFADSCDDCGATPCECGLHGGAAARGMGVIKQAPFRMWHGIRGAISHTGGEQTPAATSAGQSADLLRGQAPQAVDPGADLNRSTFADVPARLHSGGEAECRPFFDANGNVDHLVPLTGLQRDPYEPLMSYTRMFDATDARLTAALRDYVELSGDLRSGGWKAYLQRSEDFIRFASHQMIVEMLMLHGGEAQRKYVFKLRKYH